jgi:hypothetical protein
VEKTDVLILEEALVPEKVIERIIEFAILRVVGSLSLILVVRDTVQIKRFPPFWIREQLVSRFYLNEFFFSIGMVIFVWMPEINR